MERISVTYNNVVYPAIRMVAPTNHPSEPSPGEEFVIAGNSLGDKIWSEQADAGWPDENARLLDEEISYYVPDEMLDADEEALVQYLIDNY